MNKLAFVIGLILGMIGALAYILGHSLASW